MDMKTIGISLIHRHFNLKKNEKMVSKIQSHNFSSLQHLPTYESNLIPINWQLNFNSTENIWGFYPTEFLLNVSEYRLENKLF